MGRRKDEGVTDEEQSMKKRKKYSLEWGNYTKYL